MRSWYAEAIEAAVASIRQAVGTELLERIKAAPPDFFERLVIERPELVTFRGRRPHVVDALAREMPPFPAQCPPFHGGN